VAYIHLSDLRDQAADEINKLELSAAGLEKTANALKAQSAIGGSAGSALAAQAKVIEKQIEQIRNTIATKRGVSVIGMVAPPAMAPGPSMLTMGAIGLGLITFGGLGVWLATKKN